MVKRILPRIAAAFLTSLLLATMACRNSPDQDNNGLALERAVRSLTTSISGTVNYEENVPLTPGAVLTVELRDVSYADGGAPLIARRTIPNPGQVPIRFSLGYPKGDIDPNSTYAVSAQITESDGRLAFANDTSHSVITRGNPKWVDMTLVMVQPPPDYDPGPTVWQETPAWATGASVFCEGMEQRLRIGYNQDASEECARPGSLTVDLWGNDIVARLTELQPSERRWLTGCGELVPKENVARLPAQLTSGQTYRVFVNDEPMATFTVPDTSVGNATIVQSRIESAEVRVMENNYPLYELRVVSALPGGSACASFNGYEIWRWAHGEIAVNVTHHQATPAGECDGSDSLVETTVPLGHNFARSASYTVQVNSKTLVPFTTE